MNEKKDLKGIADQFSSNVDYMRTLLSAATNKVLFYMENRKLLGPYGNMLQCCAAELEDLLSLAGRFLERMDEDAEALLDFAYAGGPDEKS